MTFFSGFSDGAEVNNAGNWWEKFFGEANFISSFSFLHLEKTISELSCVYTLRLLGALRRLSALNSTSSTLLIFYGGFVTSRSTDVRCMPGWVLVPGIYRLVHLSYHLSLHFSASIVGLLTRTECGGMGRVLSWFIYIFLSSLSVILLDGAAVGNGPASWQGKECISIYHK